jgi:hypothetical protein
MDSPDYNSSHRAFLQALFARSTITFEESKPILAAIGTAHYERPILANDITFEDFQTMINTLNSSLSPFAYEIRSLHPQTSTTRAPENALFAIVNATSDPQTALATLYTPDEIAFVRRLLDAMFDTNNSQQREVMAIKGMDATRLAKAPRRENTQPTQNGTMGGGQATSITLDRADVIVVRLVEEGWLDKSAYGYLSLSTRALMELGQWLIDTYNDPEDVSAQDVENEWQRVKTCEGCKQIVTVGQRCSYEACNCRLHDFCVNTFFRGQDVRRCPKCRMEWTGSNFVGEKASRGMASATGGASRRPR